MKNELKLAIFLLPLLTSCLFGKGLTKHVVDASQLGDEVVLGQKDEFTDSYNYTYECLSCAKDEDNNFLVGSYGYILSKNGISDNIMSLSKQLSFSVFGLNGEEEEEISPSSKIDNGIETYEYNLVGYNNFKIYNKTLLEANLGVITFWC